MKNRKKTIEFILNNRAQFTTDIQKLQESHKESEKRISVLERAIVNLYNSQTETNKTVGMLAERVDKVAEEADKLADF